MKLIPVDKDNRNAYRKFENAEDLSAKIEELIVDENKRLEMGRMSRKCAEEKFDRQFSYIEILNLF